MMTADELFSLILGLEVHQDLRGFCLFDIEMRLSTIGKKIRENTSSAVLVMILENKADYECILLIT
jgi:hypothetical protein